MKRLASSYEFTDADLAAWITWFLSPESGNEKLEKEVADSLQQCLATFFASAKAFEMHLAKGRIEPSVVADDPMERD